MKKDQIQKLVAWTLLIVFFIVYIYLNNKRSLLSTNLVLGLVFGMALTRVQFSFSGNLRSPVLYNDYSYTELFYVMTIITCLGINTVVISKTMFGEFDWEAYLNEPTKVSVYFCFAAIVFGFGIALLGSAGSGLIRKTVNGKSDFAIALVFYFIGSLVGVLAREKALTYFNEIRLFMPELFGWPIAIGIQVSLLTLIYLLIIKRNYKTDTEDDDGKKDQTYY